MIFQNRFGFGPWSMIMKYQIYLVRCLCWHKVSIGSWVLYSLLHIILITNLSWYQTESASGLVRSIVFFTIKISIKNNCTSARLRVEGVRNPTYRPRIILLLFGSCSFLFAFLGHYYWNIISLGYFTSRHCI